MMYTNDQINRQLEHRSIREFTDQEVEAEKIEALKEVARQTASSMGLQQSSIVRVLDPEKRKALAEVGNQEYLARAPEFWIYVVDTYRITEIAKEHDLESKVGLNMDHFFQGFTDAALMAQNVNNAIESMGMGATFVGNVLNDPRRVIEILELPQGTFPVVGQIFGYPNQEPQLKPRMPMEFRFFEDTYERPDSYQEALADYDQEMTTYYDLRNANQRVDSYFQQVVKHLREPKLRRTEILADIRNNGFDTSFPEEE